MIILDGNNCEVIDINDYSTVSEVQIIFGRVFGDQVGLQSDTDNVLRRLLNNKLNRVWGGQDEECLDQIEKRKLTASQQIIVRQIREW